MKTFFILNRCIISIFFLLCRAPENDNVFSLNLSKSLLINDYHNGPNGISTLNNL